MESTSFNGSTGVNKMPYALVDRNKLPSNVLCQAEFIVKGDSKEYLIGAASILAKVIRDQLMQQYDTMYPEYNLAQHEGYPAKAHMALVKQYGVSPIHQQSFAPLKYMKFNDQGCILEDNS
jgi:ribonuclease HII